MPIQVVTKSQLEHLLDAETSYAYTPGTTYDSPFLHLLVSADRGHLIQSFVERQCIPGEVVCMEGEEGDTMYIIRSGRVAIVKGDLDSPTILDYQGAGHIIGEMAILENQPRSATVVALDDLRLLGLNRQKFEELVQETPSVSLVFMEMLSSRLRRADEARGSGELSEKRLSREVTALQSEKQRLEEAQRLRQETSELIIHDLRNPLSTIAVSIRMLSFVLPEEILRANQEILEIARASCERLQRLVDSLLEVSRIESGEAQFVMSEVNLSKMIEEVVQRAAILARKDTDLEAVIAPGFPTIVADRDKIERVLTNLMDNALKYVPENGRVVFAAQKQDDSIQISITDNGPGIPPEERERIFERFAQGTGEKFRRRGFGLGLTYCRLVIEGHGGRIWVEPGENGSGSRFVFTLPIS
jgi:signal transduction histidine kinase